MNRRQNYQTIAWFNDLFKRDLLDLDPPYQRRSVWPQSFKDYFIDTILLEYPAPTIFLYEEISNDGKTEYNVVDGKQRLSTIFDFIKGIYPVYDLAVKTEFRGKYFDELPSDAKTSFWSYSFSVEYLPTKDETIINNIFDRINRNVAKLTSQELRHAKYSGEFITSCENLTDWMLDKTGPYFPQIAKRSQSQMKDVELVAQILLRMETEPKGYDTDELDEAFSSRDGNWELKEDISERFKRSVDEICKVLKADSKNEIQRSRLKNQADFYTLVGSVDSLLQNKQLPSTKAIKDRLTEFLKYQVNETSHQDIKDYYEYVRAASNRTLARKERERIIKGIILNQYTFA